MGQSLMRLNGMRAVSATLALTGPWMVGIPCFPASATGCAYPGGGAFGADTTGFLPPEYLAGSELYQIVYSLVGWASLSPGCAAGELDLIAHSLTGAPATCTLVLPKPVAQGGTGCSNLLGDAGLGTETPQAGFRLTLHAELTAVGQDGTKVTRVSAPCTGTLEAHDTTAFRCPL